MLRYAFIWILLIAPGLRSSFAQDLPPFVFPELDQSLVQLWLAAEDRSTADCQTALAEVKVIWEDTKPIIADFPIRAYNPALLINTLDAVLVDMEKAAAQPDLDELAGLSYHFLWEFTVVRAFHRQYDYPLDALWKVRTIYTEIAYATNDPKLGLLEWQELECLFDELVCRLNEYQDKAEANMTLYAPQVDEDRHKAAMIQMFNCIDSYQEALRAGYRENLVWPCNEMGEALRQLFYCYGSGSETL
jgi:hypothetical protein